MNQFEIWRRAAGPQKHPESGINFLGLYTTKESKKFFKRPQVCFENSVLPAPIISARTHCVSFIYLFFYTTIYGTGSDL